MTIDVDEFLKNVEIKDCPFCGQVIPKTDPDFCHPDGRPYQDVQYYRAGCIDNMGGCGAEVIGDSFVNAIEIWNTRT